MKSNESAVFVFIATIIIGVLISLNFDLGRKSGMVILSAKQYQDAYNLKNKLHTDISDLEDRYTYLTDKLTKYKYSDNDKNQVIEEINNELKSNSTLVGSIDVHGPGIEIYLNDASTDFLSETEDYEAKIVHNVDIMYVINDLRNAGAEAISINNQRVMDKTEVYCDGPFLGVNGVKIAAPFKIPAIGNKEVMKRYMLDYESYLTYLMSPLRGIRIEVSELDDIVIKAYDREIANKYMADKK